MARDATISPQLAGAVEKAARDGAYPDGSPGRFLAGRAASRIAARLDLPVRLVDAAACAAGIAPERYARNRKEFSLKEQANLLCSRAAMVGLGGLGGHLLELLVRAGIGEISCADGDVFEESNLNRQLLSETAALGRDKARAAVERAGRVNPAVSVTAYREFLDEEGMASLFAGAAVAVDALGGRRDRPALARAAGKAGVMLVTGAAAGLSGYVAVAAPDGPGPEDFFGGGGSGEKGAEDSLGCPGPAVAAAAALMAAEVLKICCGRAPALSGSLLLFDLADMSFERVRLG